MKAGFSLTWNKSKQPRRQRKYRHNAPLHIQGKFLNAHLSADLRQKYGTRSVRLRSGDKVKIMRGKYKGIEGKVDRVDVSREKIYVTGVELTRRDGSKTHPPVRPSNLLIVELNLDDKKRLAKLKGDSSDVPEKIEKEPVKKEQETKETPKPKKETKPAKEVPKAKEEKGSMEDGLKKQLKPKGTKDDLGKQTKEAPKKKNEESK